MFTSTATIALPTSVDATALSGFVQAAIIDMVDTRDGTSELSGVDFVPEMEVAEELMSVLADFVATDTPQPNTIERTPFTSIGNIPNARPVIATRITNNTSQRRSLSQKENVKPLSTKNNKRKKRATPGSLVEIMLRPTTRPCPRVSTVSPHFPKVSSNRPILLGHGVWSQKRVEQLTRFGDHGDTDTRGCKKVRALTFPSGRATRSYKLAYKHHM
ncbi:hypothetical protein VNI00_004208 [Paramarasmius palmivorus]|uniref:Uncharacterized protein n=1 Tax=Paramarasmius palmivorus TaxID=297713 RepID=A0AAW0DMY4_9AGAR